MLPVGKGLFALWFYVGLGEMSGQLSFESFGVSSWAGVLAWGCPLGGIFLAGELVVVFLPMLISPAI